MPPANERTELSAVSGRQFRVRCRNCDRRHNHHRAAQHGFVGFTGKLFNSVSLEPPCHLEPRRRSRVWRSSKCPQYRSMCSRTISRAGTALLAPDTIASRRAFLLGQADAPLIEAAQLARVRTRAPPAAHAFQRRSRRFGVTALTQLVCTAADIASVRSIRRQRR